MTPWTAACQASLSFAIFRSLLKFTSIMSVMASNHLILYLPFLLLPSIFPSMRVFSNESALSIRRPKYWSFDICLSNECSGLISFRIDSLISLQCKGLSRVLPGRLCQTLCPSCPHTLGSLQPPNHLHHLLLLLLSSQSSAGEYLCSVSAKG